MGPDHTVQDTESTPQTPGPILRKCREFRGMSLEDAAEATKIGKNYLRALEEDRYREFTSPAYLKGFLRTYANLLGLQADDLLKMLEPEQPVESAAASLALKDEIKLTRFSWQRLLLPAALLAIILTLALVMRSTDESAKPPVVQAPTPAPAAVVQPQLSSAQQPVAPTSSPATILTPPPQSGVTLRIKALNKGNLLITLDEITTQSYDLTAGDLIEWHADRSIHLELDDPRSVSFEVNGKPYQPASQSDGSLSLSMTEQGVKP